MTPVTAQDDASDRGSADAEPFRILFVCTGNTCRSPLAAALARAELARRGWGGGVVSSAGVAAGSDEPASEGALRAAARHGLDLAGHRSTPLSESIVRSADLILTMSPGHLHHVRVLGAGDRAALITAFAAGAEDTDPEGGGAGGVPDPFGGDDEAYEAAYRALARLVSRVLDRLQPVLAP